MRRRRTRHRHLRGNVDAHRPDLRIAQRAVQPCRQAPAAARWPDLSLQEVARVLVAAVHGGHRVRARVDAGAQAARRSGRAIAVRQPGLLRLRDRRGAPSCVLPLPLGAVLLVRVPRAFAQSTTGLTLRREPTGAITSRAAPRYRRDRRVVVGVRGCRSARPAVDVRRRSSPRAPIALLKRHHQHRPGLLQPLSTSLLQGSWRDRRHGGFGRWRTVLPAHSSRTRLLRSAALRRSLRRRAPTAPIPPPRSRAL